MIRQRIYVCVRIILLAYFVLLFTSLSSWAQTNVECRNWMVIVIPPEISESCERLFNDDWYVKSSPDGKHQRCALCSKEDIVQTTPGLETDPATLEEIARQGSLACYPKPSPLTEPWGLWNPKGLTPASSADYWFTSGQVYLCHDEGFWWTGSTYHWFDCYANGQCRRNDYYDGSVKNQLPNENGLPRWEFFYKSGSYRKLGTKY